MCARSTRAPFVARVERARPLMGGMGGRSPPSAYALQGSRCWLGRATLARGATNPKTLCLAPWAAAYLHYSHLFTTLHLRLADTPEEVAGWKFDSEPPNRGNEVTWRAGSTCCVETARPGHPAEGCAEFPEGRTYIGAFVEDGPIQQNAKEMQSKRKTLNGNALL